MPAITNMLMLTIGPFIIGSMPVISLSDMATMFMMITISMLMVMMIAISEVRP